MARIRIEVCPNKARNRTLPWKVTQNRVQFFECATQAVAIRTAVAMAGARVAEGGTVTLKIKRPDGRIRDERSYPRSSDPRRSRG